MSFRTAVDAVAIAQLVGRMVRSPLARRVDDNEHLNSVALYLPHYNEQELKKIVNRLTEPDPDTMPPVQIKMGDDVTTSSELPVASSYSLNWKQYHPTRCQEPARAAKCGV